MSPPRRRRCTAEDARTRCRQAVAYLETAKLVTSDGSLPDDYDYNHVAAGVDVLAAIAASDAFVLLPSGAPNSHTHEGRPCQARVCPPR